MPEITLNAEAGREIGSAPTRRLRTEGKIPGVVYGHAAEPIAIAVSAKELRVALSGDAGLNQLLDLHIGDTQVLALARELQRHPVKNTVTHVDFLVVKRDEVVTAEIALNLVGDPVEVRHADGTVDQQLLSVMVSAIPSEIPTHIDVDISGLVVGGAIRVGDLDLGPSVTFVTDAELTIAAAHASRTAATSEDAAPAEAAPTEG